MSLARLQSRAPNGLDAPLVSVEIHLSGGLPSFAIVGLPEAAVRESRERVPDTSTRALQKRPGSCS